MAAERLQRVAHHRFLYRRGMTYYFRRGVPAALRGRFGKREVLVSLGTSNLSEARAKCAEHLFAFERLAARADQPPPTLPLPIHDAAPDPEAIYAGVRAWVAETFRRMDPLVTQRVLDDEDVEPFRKVQNNFASHLEGQKKVGASARLETEWIAEDVCRTNGWRIDPQSLHYRYLFNAVRAGQLEIAQRAPDVRALEPSPVRNVALFAPELYAADAVRRPASPSLHVCLEQFLTRPGSTANAKTLQQYRQRLSVMVEALGRNRSIGSITKGDCRKLRDEVLLHLPANYTKRFKGMSARQAIAASAASGGPLLSSKTQSLMADHLKTFFEWAFREDLIAENPARAIEIAIGADTVKRRPFSAEQLGTIFRAPIYTGCIDDARNYAKPGPSRPRGHRFWIPLIALFTGMRLNEICQLQKADIVEKGGLRFFDLTRYPATSRTLKNDQSARLVPIHADLIMIGLLGHVSRLNGPDWLFDDLNHEGHEGGSDAVSSWFGRFLSKIDLDADGLVFHSFRHTFRDGMRDVGVDRERAFAIGGWKESGVGSTYGQGFSPARLAEAMQQLRYEGLDLSHLGTELRP